MMLPDESARRRAAQSLGETLLVEASAGTGKTSTMIARLLSLLTGTHPGDARPAALTEIVAITFTERAAHELKDRLRAELFQALSEARARGGAAARHGEHFAQALSSLEQAPIGTIHSLCARILRHYPIEAGVDVQFSVLDERQSRELWRRTWEDWLARELQRDIAQNSALGRAIDVGLGPEHLRALARTLLVHRAWPVARLLAAQHALDVTWANELPAMVELVELIERKDPSTGVTRPHRPTLQKMRRWLEEIASLPDDDARTASALRPPPFDMTTKTAATMSERIDRLRTAFSHRLLVDVVGWLARPADSPDGPGFLEEYARAKQSAGVVDFDDLLIRTRDLVRDNRWVRRRLQEEYRFLIVDEFQDTDTVQAEMIVLLAQEPDGPDDGDQASDRQGARVPSRLAPGRLCVVGDPKQSIYRFRGADIETYSRVARLIGSAGRCTLSTNFRSCPQIICAVNDIFSQPGVFRSASADDAPSYRPAYHTMNPRPDAPDTGDVPRVRWVVSAESEPLKTLTEGRPREAELVAAAIHALVEEEWLVTDPDAGRARPATFGDVAVLYRTTTHLEHLEREFQRRGIPYRQLGGRTFFEREEVVRLISVLSAIEQPSDALQVVAALRSPFFGVADADLAHAALVGGCRFDYRDERTETLPESVREAFSCLRALHAQRRSKRPSELVLGLLERTRALSVYAQTATGDQAAANLLKVVDEARQLERDGPVPFRRLQEHLRSLREEGGDEGEATFDDASGSRVRMLTIHKAKGLEFPVVFVVDLAAGGGGSRGSLADMLVIRSPGFPDDGTSPVGPERADAALRVRAGDGITLLTAQWATLERADAERDEAESVRLLYVALTRARDYLLLPKVVEARGNTWQNLILGAPAAETWDRWTPRPTRDAPLLSASNDELPSNEELERERSELRDRRASLSEKGARARVRRYAPSEHERGEAGEAEPPRSAEAVDTDREQARRLGTVVHAALESLRPSDADDRVDEVVRAYAHAEQLSTQLAERALCQTRCGLDAQTVRRAHGAARCWREVNVILSERTVEADQDAATQITRGVCDLVFEDDDGLVLVDYKTDHLSPGDVQGRVEHYRPQLAAYVRALETATKRPVREAWLCFLGVGDVAREELVRLGA